MTPERAIRLNLIQIKYTNPYRAVIQEFIVLLHPPPPEAKIPALWVDGRIAMRIIGNTFAKSAE